MRKLLHAVLGWCRQRPAIALIPLLFLLYSPCLLAWSSCPLPELWRDELMPGAIEASPTLALAPLRELLASIDAALGAGLARLHSLAWLCATVGAARLALRYSCDLGERNTSWVAMMSLFIYATTCTSASTVFFIEHRPILISACFSWLSLAALAARAQGSSRQQALLSWLSLGIALLSGLGGLCGAAFIFAYAVYGDPRPRKERLKSISGHLVLTLGASLWLLPKLAPACQLQGLLGRLAHLCAQALAWLPAQPAQCVEPRAFVLALGLSCLVVAALARKWILKTASPNHVRTLHWTSAGALASLLPLLMLPADGRYLWFASLGTSFLFASAIRRCGQAMRSHRSFALLLGLGVLRHFLLAPAYTFLFTLLLATRATTPVPSQPEASKPPLKPQQSGAPAENAYLALPASRPLPQFPGRTGYHKGYAEPRSQLLAARPYPGRRR